MPEQTGSPVPSDLEIAQKAQLRPIQDVAGDAGILDEELELYGRYVAKIDYARALERLTDRPNGKLITVTAMPAEMMPRTADSLPEPAPLRFTSASFIPNAAARFAASCAAMVAANPDDLREPV